MYINITQSRVACEKVSVEGSLRSDWLVVIFVEKKYLESPNQQGQYLPYTGHPELGPESGSGSSLALWFFTSVLALTFFIDGPQPGRISQIYPLLPKFFLVLAFIIASEKQSRAVRYLNLHPLMNSLI